MVSPVEGEKYFKFYVSPCTLVFENVHSLNFDLDISEPFEIEIADIYRENPQKPLNHEYIKRDVEYSWIIQTQQGNISLKSVGYKQYVREHPILIKSQKIGLEKRNGISFEKKTLD